MRRGAALVGGYLAVGITLSVGQNLVGLLSGGLTAFAWAGSVHGTGTLLIWWLLVPALTWPVDLYWTLYHAIIG